MSKKQKGFTLVELLISVGLLAILVGVGGDLLATMLRAYRKAELFAIVERNGNYALSIIQQDIRSAIDIQVLDDTTGNPLGVPGTLDSNRIAVTIPKINAGFDTERREYFLTQCSSTTNGDITLKIDSGGASSIVDSDPTKSDLLSQVVRISRLNGSTSAFYRYTQTGASSRRFDLVYITFIVSAGGTCDDPDIQSIFQTTVNLRGGL